jgi:hypothetical protein
LEEIHVDEIVRCLQGCLKKIALDRLGSVPLWMGVGRSRAVILGDRSYQTMQMTDETKTPELIKPPSPQAEVIEFYVPPNFVRPVRWISEGHCGKLLPFRPSQKKTA